MVRNHQKLKLLREEKNWSRENFAEKVGKSVDVIAKIEQGKRKILLDEAEEFGEVFGVDPSYFFSKSSISSISTIDPALIARFVSSMDIFTKMIESKKL